MKAVKKVANVATLGLLFGDDKKEDRPAAAPDPVDVKRSTIAEREAIARNKRARKRLAPTMMTPIQETEYTGL